MKQIDVIAAVLVVIGALNWGLVAVARFDLVAALFGMQFGEVSAASTLVYGLVGLAGLYQDVGRAEPLGAPRGDRESLVRQFATQSGSTKNEEDDCRNRGRHGHHRRRCQHGRCDGQDIVDTAVAASSDAGETPGGRPR